VSQPFVGTVRKESTDSGYQSDACTGRDGRPINTANIGKARAGQDELGLDGPEDRGDAAPEDAGAGGEPAPSTR
jgi:hypothetical protein